MTEEQRNPGTRQSEAELLYRILFNQSPDGILIIDTDGRFIDFNEAAHRQLGYSREEFAQLRISDIDPCQSPEEIRGVIRSIVENGSAEFEVQHRTRAGEIRDVLVISQTVHLSGRMFFHTVWRDITDRKRFEQSQKESIKRAEDEKARSEAIIQAIGEGLSIRDTEYRLLYQNDNLKKSLGDHVGELCYKAFHGLDRVCEGCPVEKSLRDGKINIAERKLKKKDGDRYFLCTASPVRDSTGKVVGGLELVRDITERKKIEDERERLIGALQEALAKVRTLSGLLPICSSCKKIRDDKGYWNQIEAFLSAHTDAEFTHGMCPECANRAMAELNDMRTKLRKGDSG